MRPTVRGHHGRGQGQGQIISDQGGRPRTPMKSYISEAPFHRFNALLLFLGTHCSLHVLLTDRTNILLRPCSSSSSVVCRRL